MVQFDVSTLVAYLEVLSLFPDFLIVLLDSGEGSGISHTVDEQEGMSGCNR